MHTEPAVSIVIPAYNPGPFLREALDSVLEQTFKDWTCVVVDDGSSEDLTWVGELDARITLIRQANRGLSAARNAGAAAGASRLIAFLDADDRWLPEKLDRQMAAMREGVVLCATAFHRFDSQGRSPGWAPNSGDLATLLRGNSICASSTLVDRSAFVRVGCFDERLRAAEDWDLWLRLSRVGRIVGLQEELTSYRVHNAQMSNKTRAMWLWSLRVLAKQRGPIAPTLRGVRRMGEVYGAQMFDRFRADRRPSTFAWALVMWPDYVLREVCRHLPLGRYRRRAPKDRRDV